MGGAYTAAADDTGALLWNPAGLARCAVREIGIGSLELQGLVTYSVLGITHPIRSGHTLGAALLNSSDSEALSQERVLLVSFGSRVWNRLNIGMNVKRFSTAVAIDQTPLGTGRGWGVDVGLQYRLFADHLRLGIALPNLLSTVAYQRQEIAGTPAARYSESVLQEWRIGGAVIVGSLLAAAEVANGVLLIGCEYRWDSFSVRAGWRFSDGVTVGFGHQRGNIGIDYAHINGRYGATTHFTVRLRY